VTVLSQRADCIDLVERASFQYHASAGVVATEHGEWAKVGLRRASYEPDDDDGEGEYVH
jgi:hypothetical protein